VLLADKIGIATLVVASVTLVVAIAALWLAAHALWRGNRNSSAATYVTLSEGFRQAWDRVIAAEPAKRRYQLAELVNLAEVACGILHEKSLSGVTREIAEAYLRDAISILEEDDGILAEIAMLRREADTYKYVEAFISKPRHPLEHAKFRAAFAAAVILNKTAVEAP
jgi:hypothetical protein